MRLLKPFALALALLGCSCTSIWAQVISDQMVNNLLAVESYRGTLLEKRLVPSDPEAVVKKEILYQKPWKVRADVTAPAAHAGEVFLYDGEQVVMWWPRELFGIRVKGVRAAPEKEIREHVEGQAKEALKAYAYSLDGNYPLAGRETQRWRVLPAKAAPWRFLHTSWMDARYSMPLKLDLYDTKDTLWYGMEFEKIDFGAPVPADAFSLEFPPNAVVFEWDLDDPGISLEEAKKTMNFDVMLPKNLPNGHKVGKIVKSRHCLPMIAVLMDKGGTWISLTETRALTADPALALGKKIPLGDSQGYLNFFGTTGVVSWVKGKTALTLMGNASFPTLIQIAESVE